MIRGCATSAQVRAAARSIAGAMALFSTIAASPAFGKTWSVDVQEVRSRSGVTAWLVESHAQPVVALRFAFKGGSAQEPQEKGGISSVLAELLGEGEGPSGSVAFQRRAARLSARISFSSGRDALSVSLDAPSDNIDAAAELLAEQLVRPSFDADQVTRAASRSISALADAHSDPAVRAEDSWYAAAFGSHPYAMSPGGSAASIASITPADVVKFKLDAMTRDKLVVAAAGDIDEARLARVLDLLFAVLPDRGLASATPVARVSAPPQAELVLSGATKANVVFGFAVPDRHDPGYMRALVLNEVIGGGGTSSRLGKALRAREALVYDVDSRLVADSHASYLIGQFSTSATDVQRAISSLKSELHRAVVDGLTEEEVEDAKSYLIGSFPLSFDSSPKIASNLLAIAQSGLGRDYPELRRLAIKGVSRDDVNRIAAELLQPERLVIAVARE